MARTASVETEPVGDERWDLLGGADPSTVALRAWVVLVVGALATFGVLVAVYWAFPNPLGTSDLLPGAVAFWSMWVRRNCCSRVSHRFDRTGYLVRAVTRHSRKDRDADPRMTAFERRHPGQYVRVPPRPDD